MKTMKFALITILIACTTICLASADGFKVKPKKVVETSLIKACQCPGLLAAMQAQLDPSFMVNNQLVYTVDVVYQGITYRITGTEIQWKLFFSPKWKIPNEIKPEFTTSGS